MSYYAVKKGRNAGVYRSWYSFSLPPTNQVRDDCKAQVTGYSSAEYKKFSSREEAEAFAGLSSSQGGVGVGGGYQSQPQQQKQVYQEYNYSAVTTASPRRGEMREIYTDGCAFGNGQDGARAGIGVYFGPNDPKNVSEPLMGRQTNQRAEISSVIRALENMQDEPDTPVHIKTDSQYVVKAVNEWMPNWKGKEWKGSLGKTVENVDLFQRLDSLLEQRSVRTNVSYVPAHVGIEGNEQADLLAKQGAMN